MKSELLLNILSMIGQLSYKVKGHNALLESLTEW